ncbi:MAG: PaaI family thioesterase [Vulcanimicrobiaceae bacterium]
MTPIDVAAARRTWDKQKTNFIKTLDLHLEDMGHGRATMRMPFRSEVMNGAGAIHGGAIVSLCDTAFWAALASVYGREQPTATASLTCSFLRPALPPHDLVAKATVLKPGKRIVYGEVHVYSGETLVAHATLSFLNSPPEAARHAALDGEPEKPLR